MLGSYTVLEVTFIIVSLVIGVALHEMMHAVAGYWLGDTTASELGRITVNPFRSIDPIFTVAVPLALVIFAHQLFFVAKPVPFNPNRIKWEEYGVALVALAGPLTNLALAVVGALVYRLSGGAGYIGEFANYFAFINIGMGIFNLIPFPPLDGSRLLYAVAPEPLQVIMARIEQLGITAILLFVLVGFQFISPIITNIDNSLTSFLLG